MKCLKQPKVAIVIIFDIIAVTIFLIGVINFHFGIKGLPIQVIDAIGQCLNVMPGFSGIVLLMKSKI
ncbi:hypothetical protein [uncultured Parabacteroides sp.]|uniref:hypothetical protein n=1 Tax=uncultured Parabacteroides sp. TaxID=512312 RepID=UPI0025DF6113|nr:hypothetical protein [uncultured Parabacteroides sp.]